MGGVTSPLAEGFAAGIWIHDGTKWVKAQADASGNLKIALKSGGMFVPTTPWVKKVTKTTAAGSDYVSYTVTDADGNLVITNISARSISRATTEVTVSLYRDGDDHPIQYLATLAQYDFIVWNHFIFVESTDQIRCWFSGNLAGDTLELYIVGWKTAI